MTTAAQRCAHVNWLLELTGIPTAAGREHRVKAWVRRWVSARKDLRLAEDASGNLLITPHRRSRRQPVFITAHLDHPAFVVLAVAGRAVELEFRGGVLDPYFEDAVIEIFDAEDRAHRATIERLDAKAKPYKRVTARLGRASGTIAPGDVARWRWRGRGMTPEIHDGWLYTPVCDDLAAAAAALATLDVLRRRKGAGHVGVLLTVAEEVGFVGAIAACKLKTVPRNALLLCLENSRSFVDSPIGGGPILRVGDKVSVFSPDLTNGISELLRAHQARHPDFKYQRKLMPGGTCESTAFAAYGYTSTCICLPLGNYHNMVDIAGVQGGKRPARVGPEHVAIEDYHGMIELLVMCGTADLTHTMNLRPRLDRLYHEAKGVLS